MQESPTILKPTSNLKSRIIELSEKNLNDIIAIRHNIHAHPGTGYAVERTADIVSDELKRLKIEVSRGIGKTGVVGNITVPNAKRCIAIRADMDALDMQELGNPPYKSKIEGKAHMCGHDAHTAMLIGAARVVSSLKDHLKANVRFIFQPSEEQSPSGAVSMINDGALEGVDEIYAIHVNPGINEGTIGLRNGNSSANTDFFYIKIKGKGGHGADPHHTIDPIVIGAQYVTALQSIVSRNIDPFQPVVLSVTQFHGGATVNVIPDSITLKGTVRTFDEEVQKTIQTKMNALLESLTAAHGASYEFDYERYCPSVKVAEVAYRYALIAAENAVGMKNIIKFEEPVLGGEDFAYFSQKVPACMVSLGIRDENKGFDKDLHDPYFDLPDSAMLWGMVFHSNLALFFE